MNTHNDKNDGGVLFALICGALTGALIVLFTTPKSGEDLKKDLKERIEDVPDELKHLLAEAKDIYQKTYQNVKEISGECKGKFGECVLSKSEKAKQVFEQATEEARKVFQEQRQRLESALNTVKGKIKEELAKGKVSE